MKNTKWIPFFSWSSCQSKNSANPDEIDFQIADLELSSNAYSMIADLELSSNAYSMNAEVNHKSSDGNWYQKKLPIKNHESFNSDLLNQWEEAFHKGWIRLNGHVRIKTWLETSKKHKDRMIRRFRLIVLD